MLKGLTLVTNILVPAPRRFSRIKHSDWVYNYTLLRLPEFCPDLSTFLPDSLAFDARVYGRWAIDAVRRRLHLPLPAEWGYQLSQFFRLSLARSRRDFPGVLVAFERYPTNATLPVLWLTNPTDVGRLRKRGIPMNKIEAEIRFKREANARAALTLLSTHAHKKHFDEIVEPSKPTYVLPFFLPVHGSTPSQVMKKWARDETIKVLFVGRAARRKNLALVLEAYESLVRQEPGGFELTVVSSFADGALPIPALPGLTHYQELSQDACVQLMKDSHFFAMPSKEETFGWVYLESMAQGCIPIAVDNPVQRDLFDDGRAGLLIEQNASALVDVLLRAKRRLNCSKQMALHGCRWWNERYSPTSVAAQFHRFAQKAIATHPGMDGR